MGRAGSLAVAKRMSIKDLIITEVGHGKAIRKAEAWRGLG